jgi:glycosyltransferase involved in cell wall biosynthesis
MLARPVIARATRLVCDTPQIAAAWHPAAAHSSVIPLGYSEHRFRAGASREPASRGPGRVGFLGRLVPAKGVDLLVRACALPGRPWRLTVNDGPGREWVEGVAREVGVEDQLEFVALTHDRVPAFLQQLDVLALPSRTTPGWSEQFGRVLVEAMASGIPAVGSRTGAIPWVIGDQALTFPEGDAEAVRGTIDQLLSDPPSWRRARAQGLERARAFTWAAVAEQTDTLYERVLDEARQ